MFGGSTLASVRSANAAALASSKPSIALIVGGTSGIGRGIAIALARHTQGNCQILICGRSRASAESLIKTFPKSKTGADHAFVECDALLMKNVHATTNALLSRLPKLNYLVMTPGFLSLSGRQETSEGIEKKMAVHYYARWTFAHDLMPLLRRARDAGEEAKVLTVLSAGNHKGKDIDLDDLGLKTGYTDYNGAVATSLYNDLMAEEFYARNPDIMFTHAAPGLVRTPGYAKLHWSLRMLRPILDALTYPISVSEEQSGEFMLRSLLGNEKEGFYRRDRKAVDIGKSEWSSEEKRIRLWEHTVRETGSV